MADLEAKGRAPVHQLFTAQAVDTASVTPSPPGIVSADQVLVNEWYSERKGRVTVIMNQAPGSNANSGISIEGDFEQSGNYGRITTIDFGQFDAQNLTLVLEIPILARRIRAVVRQFDATSGAYACAAGTTMSLWVQEP